MASSIVQYIVVRADLLTALKWPKGAVIAQACHAATAAMHVYRDDPNTQKYLEDIDRMHKVVLETANDESIVKLSEKLRENNIDHKLWIEEPEHIPTCIATKPCEKTVLQPHFKGLKLYK